MEDEMVCPICFELMKDPVILVDDADGRSYERSALEKWLTTSNISPFTGMELSSHRMVSNRTLQKVIETFLEEQAQRQKSQPPPPPPPQKDPPVAKFKKGDLVNHFKSDLTRRGQILQVHFDEEFNYFYYTVLLLMEPEGQEIQSLESKLTFLPLEPKFRPGDLVQHTRKRDGLVRQGKVISVYIEDASKALFYYTVECERGLEISSPEDNLEAC